ncbi:MAG: hypothetical protein ACR2OB_06885 [Solirubrobacteraceae bacterium]
MVLVALTALAGAVVVHHSMPMEIQGTPGMPAHTICLAVLGLAGIVVAAGFLAVCPASFPRFASAARLRSLIEPAPRSVPARAGPLSLQVLRL